MAITPNTDFVAGNILTASQQNNFPRGIMTLVESTSSSAGITAETVTLTAAAFTAVANRYYKVEYVEQNVYQSSASTTTLRIRLTNLAGAVQTSAVNISTAANANNPLTTSRVMTFSAGSVVLVATLQSSGSGAIAQRGASLPGYLVVTDLGPA
jgi:hypothetical protein